jgi:hypothetical protein
MKIFIAILTLFSSVCLSTVIHELGHAFFDYVYGCENVKIIIRSCFGGTVKCLDPEFYSFSLDKMIFTTGGGILFGILFGVLFFFVFKRSKNYLLSLCGYFFSLSNFDISVFDELSIGPFKVRSDVKSIMEFLGLNPSLISVFGFILSGLLLILFVKEFSNLLKSVDSKISEKGIKVWEILFVVFLLIVMSRRIIRVI